MKENKVITVAIADDHKIFRDGLRILFKKEGNIELVGEAANGKELLEIVKKTRPDIVITDIVMPEMNGITAVKQILELYPETGIIGLSMVDDDDLLIEIFEAGALGYLLKNAEKEEILEAINCVINGVPYYSSSISGHLIKLISESKFNPYKGKKVEVFNDIEQQIVSLICQEKTSKEIGEILHYSIRTIEWYRVRIMEKMQVKTTTGIVIYAIKNKLCKI
ncbi:MAG: two component transcriptional regulator, LuxR family [Segetibacter sp.]|nr:two component transcriptional regulator, LuxR family [Segetibacter sp.]